MGWNIKKMGWFLSLVTSTNVRAITLMPFGIYIRERFMTDKTIINHEMIHVQQQFEMLFIFFYLWYFIEWLIRIFVNGRRAYVMISFEQEAYGNEKNMDYLKTRKHFCWLKYIIQ